MTQRTRVLAFDAWAAHTLVGKQLKSTARRVMLRLSNAAVLGAFSRWAEFRAQLLRVKVIALRLAKPTMSRSYHAWLRQSQYVCIVLNP